jgi:hypothetical protein
VRDLKGVLQKMREATEKVMRASPPHPRWASGLTLVEDVYYPITRRQIRDQAHSGNDASLLFRSSVED